MHLSKVLSLVSCGQEGGEGVRKPLIEYVDFSKLYMDRKTSMFFEEEAVVAKYRNLLKPACSVCKEIVTSVKALYTHVQVQHGGRLCNVCMFYRKAYFVEQIVFDTKKSLDDHIRASHPCCLFCRKNLYDDDQLFEHLTQNHESCHICERNGRLYEYYRDYHSLEQHFKEEHFPCLQDNCRGVVFATSFELELHRQREHTHNNASSRRARTVTIQSSSLYSDRAPRNRLTGEERERRRRRFHGARIYFTGEGSTVIDSQPVRTNTLESFHDQSTSDAIEQVNNTMDHLNMDDSAINSSVNNASSPALSRMHPSNTFIIPQSPTSKEEYDRRNVALLDSLREVLSKDSDYSQFIEISKQLRTREMEPVVYISKAIDILGCLSARRILPELISLLPDKQMQKQLQQAACNNAMLASRNLITENEQVIQRQRNTQIASDSRHETEFPSLQNATASGSEIARNYASGKWKQLSQVVATNTTAGHSQNFEAAYPALSEDSSNSSVVRKGVWNHSTSNSEQGSSNAVHENGNNNNSNENCDKRKPVAENFPALRRHSNEVASSLHSNERALNSRSTSNKGRVNLRGSNLPRVVGMNGFSWENKRKKKIIQAAKNRLKETSPSP